MGVTGGLGAAVAGMLLAGYPCAFALNPAFDVSQYAHTTWKIRDGFTRGIINSIAQTPDGYLWLGTEFGLLRFDGVQRVAWTPPAGEQLPSTNIVKLLVTRDGRLWIGTAAGLVSWKDGKLIRYPALAGQDVVSLLEDGQGTIWAGTLGGPTGRLCAIQGAKAQCYGEDGRFAHGVLSLYEYRGNLWAGALNGLWRWKPDPPKLYPAPSPLPELNDLIEGDNGALWIAMRGGIRRLVDGKIQAYPLPAGGQFDPLRLLRDHEGGLWIGTLGEGLVHVHRGRTDVFTSAEGLSGDRIFSLFEDRESNIWASTSDGLDRFREFAVPTISVKQGLPRNVVGSILAARDGSIWVGSGPAGLSRWKDGQITIYLKRSGLLKRPSQQGFAREVYDDGLPDNSSESLFQDERGRIWVSTLRGMAYFEDGRFIRATSVPSEIVHSIAEEGAGNLWINDQNVGLVHSVGENVVERIPWAKLGREDIATTLAADPLQGGLWLGFLKGGVAYFKAGQVLASYGAAEGIGSGRVNDLRFDPDGTLWAATAGGLSRLKNGHIATLSSRNGLPCDAVHSALEDDAHSFWLFTACGLVRIARSELDAWTADPKHMIKTAVFDSSDGIRSTADAGGYTPQAAKSADGKLWFASLDGVGVVDPGHLPFNKLPPPVVVETVKVNGKEVAAAEGMELSHRSNDLEIDYTALSLTIPERVQFRYKLEGHDADWQDVGTRRQAYYGGLAPKQYRFRVMACNNDGVWNEAGAAWSFSIVPAYYQTAWFRGLLVLAGAGLIWLAFRLRVRKVTARVNLLYNERLAERTRIARDLHDTLLQSLAGVSLQLDGISKQAGKAPEKVPSLIGRVRDQVDSAFREARVKVWDLRSTALEDQGLEGALRQLVQRMGLASTARCEVAVTGEARPCSAEVEEELLRIAQESANNANRHAQASEIRIGLEYAADALTLSIADNGRGFDFAEGYGKSGHWGLKNMQERAAQIRGTCKITTAVGQGTQIEVRVPLSGWSLRNALTRNTLAKHAHSNSAGR
jgi:signal transduction histidine kinase/ligand-binding sensor domain-containing protein